MLACCSRCFAPPGGLCDAPARGPDDRARVGRAQPREGARVGHGVALVEVRGKDFLGAVTLVRTTARVQVPALDGPVAVDAALVAALRAVP